MRENILRDTLYNLSLENTRYAPKENRPYGKSYGKGILVGLISGLMAFEEIDFHEAGQGMLIGQK
jgi:hypothetical protein